MITRPLGRGTRIFRLLVLLFLVPVTALAWLIHVPTTLGLRSAASVPECGATAPVTGRDDAAARLRVFAIGYHLDLADATSYETWRAAMRCIMDAQVKPHIKPGVPTLVVFPEDIGLPTVGVGTRGATVRAQAESPARAASDAVPLGMAGALAQLNLAYAPQIAAYQARFGGVDPRKQAFLAATDTFARAFSRTFSEIARDYGVYVVASNNQARYRVSHDPVEVALFGDPSHPDGKAYVAVDDRVPNTTFLWGPSDVDPKAPDFEHNLLFRNEKVPLTPLESDLLGLDEGPARGPAALANASGPTIAGFHLGFATSLPAFQYGYDFGQRPAEGFEPCLNLRVSYAACQDALGVDLMIQADANPGRWATAAQSGGWQPLEWMGSTWRAVADPTVRFRYNVTPMMTGNLFDLVFDGQSAITGRGAKASPARYAGNAAPAPTDPPAYAVYAGDKTEFLALAPWAGGDGPRAGLERTAAELAGGSGSARENGYLESVIYADLA